LRPFPTLCLVIACITLVSAADTDSTIRLAVDANDAPRNILHARLTIPVRPGPLTLVYPKWIPGNHRPSGPIANVTGLRFEAAGKILDWQRDPVDMYAFHVQVPEGTTEIVASFDTITATDSAGATGSSASSQLLDVNWNQVVLYPQGAASDDIKVTASLQLPPGWRFGTALPVEGQEESSRGLTVKFLSTSLTTLVDSPLIAGAHYRQIELTKPDERPRHVMDLVAESDAALQMTPRDVDAYKRLVAEAGLLFGARHYRDYHFLYTLSGEVGHHGLEHHESSDNSSAERTLIDPKLHLLEAGLLPHEFVHSWNGKYRRPAGLATRNYQEPMIGELLWVYEGLTEYLGNVLTARSGLWTSQEYREALALTAADLDHTPGRSWRPLEDTAISVQSLRLLGREWENWRRGLDYYPEGELIWLEVDTRIRELTENKASLDDFCRRFHGGETGRPRVVPYALDDVIKVLNEVVPFDWAGLLKERVNATSTHAPLRGIEQGGWRLVYNGQANQFMQTSEKIDGTVNLAFSLGFWVKKDGELLDVVRGSPAYEAGLGPGMRLIAVNGRRWSPEVLRDAIALGKSSERPIQIIAENKLFYKTYEVAYHEGEKYPHLERLAGQPDRLSAITSPKAP
jgi:predicted metalloprotease with PDZ domain